MLGIRYIALFRNWSAANAKIRSDFALFDPLSKLGRVGELSESKRTSVVGGEDGSIRFSISCSVSKP